MYGHRLLDGLSHAITLELHALLHELALKRGLQTCPMFSNLTRLVLGDWCMAADFYPLLHILQRSKCLQEEYRICKDSEICFIVVKGHVTDHGKLSFFGENQNLLWQR